METSFIGIQLMLACSKALLELNRRIEWAMRTIRVKSDLFNFSLCLNHEHYRPFLTDSRPQWWVENRHGFFDLLFSVVPRGRTRPTHCNLTEQPPHEARGITSDHFSRRRQPGPHPKIQKDVHQWHIISRLQSVHVLARSQVLPILTLPRLKQPSLHFLQGVSFVHAAEPLPPPLARQSTSP